MRRLGFYPKLAATGIRKNGNTYGPYLLTCICMIMMSYLMRYLGANPVIAGIKGGRSVQEMLGMGNGVFIIFSLIFVFYTNSFLIRRRKREFGLYNILGMGKWNLARILVWECILTTAYAGRADHACILGGWSGSFSDNGAVSCDFCSDFAEQSAADPDVQSDRAAAWHGRG